jgi:Xaa-Pro aminopeptidase
LTAGTDDASRLPTAQRKVLTEPLRTLMQQSWLPPEAQDVVPHPAAGLRAERRARLAAAFPGETLVVPSGGLRTRANDTTYPFRPGSDITWLDSDTPGSLSPLPPGAVLVVHPDGSSVLHQAPPFDRDGTAWFTDYHGEVTDGPRPPLDEVATRLGVATAPLDALRALEGRPARVVRGLDPEVDAAWPERSAADAELTTWLAEARLVKDPWEVEQLQDAVDATVRGFEDVARTLPQAVAHGERWPEGVFQLRARLEGNAVGYGSICAAGARACTLHYVDNSGPVRPGDLLVLDMGVENDELYTADITRTLPVSGTFTPVQRRLYTLVHEAQQGAIAAVRPGARFDDPDTAAAAVLARGLEELGLVASAAEVLRPEDRRHRRWTVHRVSHMLGLDVHDCAAARDEHYADGTLQVGHVLTVEPGLYFRADDALVPPELRGTGIRIEDDVVVTEDGCRVLSAALPSAPDDVEAWLARLGSESGHRL